MNWDEVLEHRHTWKVQWEEPWPGMSTDGQDVTCHVLYQATVHDAINFERECMRQRGKFGFTDNDLLQDFIVIHWAQVIKE
jgi:hypothetical protein